MPTPLKINKINKSASEPAGKPTRVPIRKMKKKLMDEKVAPRRKKTDFSMNMALAVLALLVFAVGIFVYFFFFQNTADLASDQRPEIIIPEESVPLAEPEPVVESNNTETPAEEPVVQEPVVEVLKIKILDTPTGFLNVRIGPGTGFEKIGTINPGGAYELVSENSDQTWYEIQLEGGTGWVIKTYAALE